MPEKCTYFSSSECKDYWPYTIDCLTPIYCSMKFAPAMYSPQLKDEQHLEKSYLYSYIHLQALVWVWFWWENFWSTLYPFAHCLREVVYFLLLGALLLFFSTKYVQNCGCWQISPSIMCVCDWVKILNLSEGVTLLSSAVTCTCSLHAAYVVLWLFYDHTSLKCVGKLVLLTSRELSAFRLENLQL